MRKIECVYLRLYVKELSMHSLNSIKYALFGKDESNIPYSEEIVELSFKINQEFKHENLKRHLIINKDVMDVYRFENNPSNLPLKEFIEFKFNPEAYTNSLSENGLKNIVKAVKSLISYGLVNDFQIVLKEYNDITIQYKIKKKKD